MDIDIEDIVEIATPIMYTILIIGGIVGVEYLYFTRADEVRLLFVLLLIPIGALLGFLAGHLIVVVLAVSLFAGVVAAILFIVGGIISVLYNTVIWTN